MDVPMDIKEASDAFFQQNAHFPVEVPVASFTELGAGEKPDQLLWTSFKVVLGSFVGFWIIFLTYCSVCRMARITDRSRGFIMNLCQILVSQTHAVIAAVAGVKIVFHTWSDMILAKSPLTNWYAMVFTGYILYDIIAMLATDLRMGKTFMEICRSQFSIYMHHILFSLVVPPVALFLRDGRADYVIGCFLTMEIPVIFLHNQHVLSMFGRSGSRSYLVNGLVTLVTYFIFRVILFPFMFYRLALRKGVSFLHIHKHVSKFCAAGSLTVFALQIYWFCLLVRKAFRVRRAVSATHKEDKSI